MFKIWDKVRIKSREQMEKEFGLDEYWDIDMSVDPVFTSNMKYLCWRTAEIYDIMDQYIKLVNWSNNEETIWFDYSIDMIELIEQERTPTPWEYVEIGYEWWRYKRMYICTNNNTHYYIEPAHVGNYNNWEDFTARHCEYIRPIQTKQSYTIESTEEQWKHIQEILS